MNLKDTKLKNIVKNRVPILINNREYIVEANPLGTCDGCYFLEKNCPAKAVNICCLNGGNILKLVETK